MVDVDSEEEQLVRSKVRSIKGVLNEVRATSNVNYPDYSQPDEVYPGVFIGDECCARDKTMLRRLNITHIVNSASGKGFGMVSTNANYYADLNIKFLGIELSDLSVSDISCYFQSTAEFIDLALREAGKVLVHCLMGISRSSTLVIAFLMIKRHMTAVEAVIQVRQNRNIHPNDGFISQLASLDVSMEKLRSRNKV